MSHARLISYRDVCRRVIQLDPGIRSASVAGMDGRIISAQNRRGFESVLTATESELSILQSVIRMSMRKTLEPKLGRTIYSFTLYESDKRATIVIPDNSRTGGFIMSLSFDMDAEAPKIIEEKIMPFIKKAVSPSGR